MKSPAQFKQILLVFVILANDTSVISQCKKGHAVNCSYKIIDQKCVCVSVVVVL